MKRAPLAILILSVMVLYVAGARAQEAVPAEDFPAWLAGLRADAESQGIRPATLDAAFEGIEVIPRVIELDRHQPEFTQTFSQYMALRITDKRVERGRRMLAENNDLLTKVADRYGVQARFVAAIWGMETNYGSFMGTFPVIASLATLAYDGRRSVFFRKELLNALKIIDDGHIGVSEMMGSWAGAMGQSQFMPSSFLNFARDFNDDGRADIWTTPADVFASIANYLARNGWSDDHTWGREVRLPANFATEIERLMPEQEPRSCRRALRHHTKMLDLDEWQRLGVRRIDGRDLPKRGLKGSLVLPAEGETTAYLTYANYRSILRYNCSNFYGIAVGTLADRISR